MVTKSRLISFKQWDPCIRVLELQTAILYNILCLYYNILETIFMEVFFKELNLLLKYKTLVVFDVIFMFSF